MLRILVILSAVLIIALGLAFAWLLPSENPQYQVFVAGDTMLARRMHRADYGRSVESLFNSVLPLMRDADLSFLNLECVVADRGEPIDKGERRSFYYRARPSMLRFLQDAGVDVVSQANNHAGDYGPVALLDSTRHLADKGILAIGAGDSASDVRSLRYSKLGDLTLAWIGLDTTARHFSAGLSMPGTLYVPENLALQEVLPLIEKARTSADLVFLSVHWGGNWGTRPSSARKKLARQFVDAGVDVILGHSSHVPQGVEYYKGSAIFYDLGSLLFDSVSEKKIIKNLVFVLTLDAKGLRRVKAYPIRLNWGSVDLAQGSQAEQIMDLFLERSRVLNDKLLMYSRSDTHLDFSFEPKLSLWSRISAFWRSKEEQSKLDTSVKQSAAQACEYMSEENLSPKFSFVNGVDVLDVSLPASVGRQVLLPISTTLRYSSEGQLPPLELRYTFENSESDFQFFHHHEPQDWACPTTSWKAGDVLQDKHYVRLPTTKPRTKLSVYLELRDMRTRQSIPTSGGSSRFFLGTIESNNSSNKPSLPSYASLWGEQ